MRQACTLCPALFLAVTACAPSVDKPPMIPAPVSAFVEVPYPPPAAHAEVIPKRPHSGDVWVDGQWSWLGNKWRWEPGAWVTPPAGAKFQPWMITRRKDGQTVFAEATWRDAEGRAVDAPVTARATRRTTPDHQSEAKR